MRIKYLQNLIQPVLALALIILSWHVFARIIDIAIILPTPAQTFSALGELIKSGEFLANTAGTLVRALLSFCISFFASLALALLCAQFKWFYRFIYPFIVLARAVPTMSVILIAVIWLGSKKSPILVSALVILPMMFSAFYQAMISRDKNLEEMSKAFEVPRSHRLLYFYIPAIAENMFSQVISCLSLSVKLIIAAEVFSQTKASMGLAMNIKSANLQMDGLLAWTIVAIVLSYALEVAVRIIQHYTLIWKKKNVVDAN